MHDPLVVAAVIRRPWPRLTTSRAPGRRWQLASRRRPVPGGVVEAEAIATGREPYPWWRPRGWVVEPVVFGRRLEFPALVTIWHREPGGHDSGEICRSYRRVKLPDGTWTIRTLSGWRWHVHHWHLQVHPLQRLRRTLLTRCTWCGGRHRKGDPVNCSHQWDGPRGRWWRGEPGLYHHDCSAVEHAHRSCACDEPDVDTGFGTCARCGRYAAGRQNASVLERRRLLASIPAGRRDPVVWARVKAIAAAARRSSP